MVADPLDRRRSAGVICGPRRVRPFLAATVAAIAPTNVRAQEVKLQVSDLTKEKMEELASSNQGLDSLETLGCFNYGYRYHPAMEVPGQAQPFHVGSAVHCQAWCKAVSGCKYFAYWLGTQECWLGSANAQLVMAKSFGAVSGPAVCPGQPAPACTGIPGYKFPAQSVRKSQSAWDSGFQPTNLQCWPRKASGFPQNCSAQEVQILEDTDTGWPGNCDDLKLTDLMPGECQIRCMYNPLCAVWQTKGSPARCYHGMFGRNCYSTVGERPLRAQRLMHGDFRVLMNTAGTQIMGLQQAFLATDLPNLRDAERHCRMICVSFLLCQYWQFSNIHGCWLEDVRETRVAYPLVNDGVNLRTNSAGAHTVTAGEFIQHTCKEGSAVPLPLDDPTATITTTTGYRRPPDPAPRSGGPDLAPRSGGWRTILTSPVVRGISDQFLEVESVGDLMIGDHIRLRWKPESLEEAATVSKIESATSIELNRPLQHAFPRGTIVDYQPGLHPDALEPECYESAFGATDRESTGCEYYGDYPSSCSLNDDEDFTANDMCCECGGGSPTVPTTSTTQYSWASKKTRFKTSGSNEEEEAVFGGAQEANHTQEITALVLLFLAILICVGCIVVAWLVALEKRKENKAHSKGRELAYATPEGADQSFYQSDATSFQSEAPASPQGYAAAMVPTQVMPQANPYSNQYPEPAFDGYGGGAAIQGGPIGGQNQYYDPAPTQRNYWG